MAGCRWRRPVWRSAARAAVAFAVLGWTTSWCAASVLDPQGPVGAAERTILINSLAIMLAIVVPTIIATLAFAWWFRASNTKARYRPDWAYSGEVELVTWSIPVLVILFLGGIAWIGSHDLDPYRMPEGDVKPLRVQVVSLDWKWLFIYPDHGIASVNRIVVPAGTPLDFSLTSASVMNAFFVPQLGSMIYTMNGMATRLYLKADHEGEFEGLSSHFSGDGFAGMRFGLRAVGPNAFARWIEDARASPDTLDENAYRDLAKQSTDVAPKVYRAVATELFDGIVSQSIPPAPGPDRGHPGPAVSSRPTAAICTPAFPRGEARVSRLPLRAGG